MPAPLTRFFGREPELAQVAELLERHRLVTLTGAGGVGKTRLALEVAPRVRSWSDGAWFVDLGPVLDGPALDRRVSGALGVTAGPDADPVAALVTRLGTRRLLLTLDTCEQLVEPVGTLVTRLLQACPGLVVLTTSREPLGVPGEVVFQVPPLDGEVAGELFDDRAALAHPQYEPGPARPAVDSICARLDRIPLAIELAASWVGILTPAEISAGLDDALGLLASDGRALSPRHRTLRASLTWSYQLLTDAERAFFRRLGVFAGAFTAVAAGTVAAEVTPWDGDEAATLRRLRRLVAASLVTVQATGQGAGTTTRFRLLDTVRQFALDRLEDAGEVAPTRDRHLEHHLWLAERGERGLDEDQDSWRTTLATHHDDIAAALRWGLATPGPAERALPACRSAAAMARHWMLTGDTREGLEFLARATTYLATHALGDAEADLQARLHAGTGMVAMVGGNRALVTEAAERGLAAATSSGSAAAQARCRMLLAYPLFFTDFARCHELVVRSGEQADAVGDAFVRDWSRVVEGYSQQTRGHHDDAVAAARAAVAGALPRGDRFTAAFGLGVELFVAMVCGRVEEAIDLGRRAVELAAPLGDYFAVGTNTVNAALPLALSGDLDAAHRLMDPVVVALETAPPADVVGFMVSFGYAALWGGDLDTALRWFRLGVEPTAEGTLDWTAGRCLPGLVKTMRHLGDAEALREAQWAVEVETAFDTPYELANALDELGHLLRRTDPSRARGLHHDALELRIRHGIRLGYVDSLDALAGLDADAGNHAEAVRLLAAATCGRDSMRYPRPVVDRPAHDQTVTQLRHELGERAFHVAWDEGRGWDLDQAVAVVSRGRGPRQRPDTGWASLTPTEADVTALVVGGLSNPEVARRLFMSRSTVKTHLTHIYAKLGVTNRTQLAAAAAHRTSTADDD